MTDKPAPPPPSTPARTASRMATGAAYLPPVAASMRLGEVR